MSYKLEDLTPRQFEVLAINYAKDTNPNYNWILTQKTIDFNRDFEAIYNNEVKWGEAKHTNKSNTTVSKSRWDPTMVSAVLKNNVNEIYLITCGWIPLEYIVRAEHFKSKNINSIYYINRHLLDKWLAIKNDFENFNEETIDMNQVMAGLKTINFEASEKIECLINFFNPFNNVLEPAKELEKMYLYELNITVFSSIQTFIEVKLPENFVVSESIIKNLSTNIVYDTSNFDNRHIKIQVQAGYIQFIIAGLFDTNSNKNEEIHVKIGNKKFKKQFKTVNIKKTNNISEIANVENKYNEALQTESNIVVCSNNLKEKDLINGNHCCYENSYCVFRFNNSLSSNSIEICKLILFILLGISIDLNNQTILEDIVNNTLEFCPEWLNRIIIGTTNYIYANYAIETFDINTIDRSLYDIKIPEKTMIFIDNYEQISCYQKKVLDEIFKLFKNNSDSCIIILNNNNFKNKTQFNKHSLSYECKYIDKILKKDNLTNDEINNVVEIANAYYSKTDFFKAMFVYKKLIDNNLINIDSHLNLCFQFADCLNHCGSMAESQYYFEKALKIGDVNDKNERKIIFESKTELFNLKFWRLDVVGLVNEIDNMLCLNKEELTNKSSYREKYAYFNCLNRKMVTQYLMGEYQNAEKTFLEYIKQTKSGYENYKAFAYMDSDRGLYAKDIHEAKKRLEIAFGILKELQKEGKEKRRYYDCQVELEYVNFIITFIKDGKAQIHSLQRAVREVQNNGYKNMLLKCYLKLATCYLALFETKKALKYLTFIKNNCDFNDNIRVSVLYNSIISNYYKIENLKTLIYKPISSDYLRFHSITFNCTKEEGIILETRIW